MKKINYFIFNGKELNAKPSSDLISFLKGKDYVVLNEWKKYRYIGYPGNDHHFSTKFHFENILPLYNKYLNFSFKNDDFYWIKYNENKFDLSYPYPLKDKEFDVDVWGGDTESNLHYGIKGNFNKLSDRDKNFYWSNTASKYHSLFVGWHRTSKIVNNSENNNKNLLCICDSQIIPDAPQIAYYYKCTCFLDKRCKNIPKEIYDVDFDDVIVSIYTNDTEYLTNILNRFQINEKDSSDSTNEKS